MLACPYCLEDIKPGARKCPHCQTSLVAAPPDAGANTVYILDKGLVRFGKFIAAALGAFLIVGVYIYGLELKDAIKKSTEAEIEVKRGVLAVETQKNALEVHVAAITKAIARIDELEKEVIRHRDETKQNAVLVKELVGEIRQQKDVAVQLIVEIQARKLNPQEETVASARREERGIGTDRGKLWKNGSALRFVFLDGQDKQKQLVRNAVDQWSRHANLAFKETDSKDAEIRISFKQEGSWSFVGTDALAISKDQPTINYGTMKYLSDQTAAAAIALHEFGHALGLDHEFLNPSAHGLFNDAAFEEYAKTAGMSVKDVKSNLLRKAEYPGSRPYDRLSIMNYALPASLFLNPEKQAQPGNELSESDKKYIASLYPHN